MSDLPVDTTEAALVRLEVPLDDDNLDGALSLVLSHMHIDRLDRATRGLNDQLAAAIAEHAKGRRAEREALLGPRTESPRTEADVAQLVRELGHASDVLGRIGKDFLDAAKAAQEEIGYEALDEVGVRRMVIADGDTEIVITPNDRTDKVWSLDAVAESIARDVTLREADRQEGSDEALPVSRRVNMDDDALDTALDRSNAYGDYLLGFRAGAEAGIVEAVEQYLSSPKWKSTALNALRRLFMARGDDSLASVLERALKTVTTEGDTLKVERTAFKANRRAPR